MKEQIFILENFKSFEPKHIFECGQCFRWNIEQDGSYTGVFGNNVLNVKKDGDKIIFKGLTEQNIIKVCTEYFDLDTNYDLIKNELSNIDDFLKTSIEYGEGIRILKQDLWETIISFIISANNNIPRIKGIIERISQKYGNQIEWNGSKYYTFPTVKQLSKASVEELRELGLGFRDKRVHDTTQIFMKNEMTLEEFENEKDLELLKEKLLTLPGVGGKVADCILLFSLGKIEAFPVDTWIKKVMNELYVDSTNITKINQYATQRFGEYAGIAQQYLFYYKREN